MRQFVPEIKYNSPGTSQNYSSEMPHYKLEFVSYDLKCFTNRSIIKCIFIMQSLFYFHSVGKRLEALQELSSLAQQSTEDNFAIAADDFCSKYS